MAKTFRVGTFPPIRGSRSKMPLCYTRWYNPAWEGCIEYTVEAESGEEAKKKAAALRRAADAVTYEIVDPSSGDSTS